MAPCHVLTIFEQLSAEGKATVGLWKHAPGLLAGRGVGGSVMMRSRCADGGQSQRSSGGILSGVGNEKLRLSRGSKDGSEIGRTWRLSGKR